ASPACPAVRASRRHSGQLAGHRSGTRVAERPDEQLAPNRPILSWLPLYIARRFGNEASRAGNGVSVTFSDVIVRSEATKQSPPSALASRLLRFARNDQDYRLYGPS